MPDRGDVLLWKTLNFWKRKKAGDRVFSCHHEASMVPEGYQGSWEDLLLSGTKTPYRFILPQNIIQNLSFLTWPHFWGELNLEVEGPTKSKKLEHHLSKLKDQLAQQLQQSQGLVNLLKGTVTHAVFTTKAQQYSKLKLFKDMQLRKNDMICSRHGFAQLG